MEAFRLISHPYKLHPVTSTQTWGADSLRWMRLTGDRRHLTKCLCPVTLPGLLWNQSCCIWTRFAPSLPTGFTNSHCPPPSFPPQLPLDLPYCHLHLHSGPFQWWEAFISAARQDADMERAAVLQRTLHLSEHMQARVHIWDLNNQKAFSQIPHKI